MERFLIMAILVSLFFFGLLLILVKKRVKFSWGSLFLGALGFLCGVLVVESIVNLLVFQLVGRNHPIFTLFYGALAAGIFEESARWVIFHWIARKRTIKLSDSWGVGLGHGGIEFLLTGMSSFVLSLVVLESVKSGRAATFPEVLVTLVRNLTPFLVVLSVVERFLALFVQVCLTFWVFQAVRTKNMVYFGGAILLHTGMDLLAGLYQQGFLTSPLLVESLLGVYVLVISCVTYFLWKRRWNREFI